ncbi:MAG: hypothetical protein ACREX3_15440 [Gammaproteobacteria bacterium]
MCQALTTEHSWTTTRIVPFLFLIYSASTFASDDKSIEELSLKVLHDYTISALQQDATAMVRDWHPKLLAAAGGRTNAISATASMFKAASDMHATPDRIAIGTPTIYRDAANVLVLFPARLISKGFPAEIETPHVYAVSSEDGGTNWFLIDVGCIDETWVRSVFPRFPSKEFVRIETAPFETRLIVTKSGTSKNSGPNNRID